jgi:hypothetical protein
VKVLTTVAALCDVEEKVVGSGARDVVLRVEVGAAEELEVDAAVVREARRCRVDEGAANGGEEDAEEAEEEESGRNEDEEERRESGSAKVL